MALTMAGSAGVPLSNWPSRIFFPLFRVLLVLQLLASS